MRRGLIGAPLWFFLIGGGVGLAPLWSAEVPPQERLAQPRTVFSASRRFMISGLPAARGAEIGVWADQLAERIQRQLGPIPFERGQLISIAAMEDADGASGVHARQECREGIMHQTLSLAGLETLDVEQAEEALGSLLISRYIQALQTPEARCADAARAPDWLTVGLVHRTRHELRRRNQSVALERWRFGEMESFSALVESHFLPPGRWPQKADAMMLVNWLMESPRGPAMIGEAFRFQAEQGPPDPAWWARLITGRADPGYAERAWDLWIAELQDRTRPIGSGDLRAVLRMGELPGEELERVGAPLEWVNKPLSALIAERRQPWARPLALRLAMRARLESIGQDREAARLAESYAQFLDAVAQPLSARRLRALWKKAEEQRERAVEAAAAVQRFLDAAESRVQSSPRAPDVVQRYLDEVEQRFAPP